MGAVGRLRPLCIAQFWVENENAVEVQVRYDGARSEWVRLPLDNDQRGGHDCHPHEMINGACGVCHEKESA